MGTLSGMSLAPLDFLAGTACTLCPGTIPWGAGWYLIAENTRVEAGPFATEEEAVDAAWWLDDQAMGVHPAWEQGEKYGDDAEEYDGPPYQPRYSAHGLLVGSRVRDRKKKPEETPEMASSLSA